MYTTQKQIDGYMKKMELRENIQFYGGLFLIVTGFIFMMALGYKLSFYI